MVINMPLMPAHGRFQEFEGRNYVYGVKFQGSQRYKMKRPWFKTITLKSSQDHKNYQTDILKQAKTLGEGKQGGGMRSRLTALTSGRKRGNQDCGGWTMGYHVTRRPQKACDLELCIQLWQYANRSQRR